MEVAEKRPKLESVRALAFQGENRSPATAGQRWTFQMTQTIQVGLTVPAAPGGILQAVVLIGFVSNASNESLPAQKAEFRADYEAKFDYPALVTEADVSQAITLEPYQYILVAQAFPLAMTHFRRAMESMGFDAREMPLGI